MLPCKNPHSRIRLAGFAGPSIGSWPEQVEHCINDIGIGFLFAPALHGAMKHAIGPRREIGIRTIFNILGPLTNPAGADRQVLGVYQKSLVEPLAHVLQNLGCKRGFVVHGDDGMDEITMTGPTTIASIDSTSVTLGVITPEMYGFTPCTLEELQGGDADDNAQIVKDVLTGDAGPKRDVVLLNAGYALVAAGVADTVEIGIANAAKAIDSGVAMKKLEELIAKTNR